jgi:TPR repeat protein
MIKILDPSYKSPSKSILPQANKNNNDDFLDTLSIDDGYDENPWDEALETADAYYYGLGDEIQDHYEALKYFKKAADLGSDDAMLQLGIMYSYGEACNKDLQRALSYLKDGAKLDNLNCYAEMARLFGETGNSENVSKCWDKFFSNFDRCNKRDISRYFFQYFIAIRYDGIEYKYKNMLLPHKLDLVARLESLKNRFMESGDQESADYFTVYFGHLQ